MRFARDTFYLLLRELRITLRMPVWLIMAVVQPIIWLLLFSQLFQAVGTIESFPETSYLRFLTPGLAIMAALFSSSYSGMGILRDIERGVMDRLLATPTRRASLIGSRVLHAAVSVMIQAGVILVMSILMGIRPGGGVLGAFWVLLAAGVLGIALGAVSNGLAIVTGRQELLLSLTNFAVLPLTFLSTMIMARPMMPDWMKGVARFNPVDWAVTVARNGFRGTNPGEVTEKLVLLVLFAAICWVLAARAFARHKSRS